MVRTLVEAIKNISEIRKSPEAFQAFLTGAVYAGGFVVFFVVSALGGGLALDFLRITNREQRDDKKLANEREAEIGSLKIQVADMTRQYDAVLQEAVNLRNFKQSTEASCAPIAQEASRLRGEYQNIAKYYDAAAGSLKKCEADFVIKNEMSVVKCDKSWDFVEVAAYPAFSISKGGWVTRNDGGNFMRWELKGLDKNLSAATLSVSDNGEKMDAVFNRGDTYCMITPTFLVKFRTDDFSKGSQYYATEDSVRVYASYLRNPYRRNYNYGK